MSKVVNFLMAFLVSAVWIALGVSATFVGLFLLALLCGLIGLFLGAV